MREQRSAVEWSRIFPAALPVLTTALRAGTFPNAEDECVEKSPIAFKCLIIFGGDRMSRVLRGRRTRPTSAQAKTRTLWSQKRRGGFGCSYQSDKARLATRYAARTRCR